MRERRLGAAVEHANARSPLATAHFSANFFWTFALRGSSRVNSFAAHFIKKTKMLALTIMATKSSMQRFPFHVGLNST